MNWSQALIVDCLAVVAITFLTVRPKRRRPNRRLRGVLSPPADACRRNGPECVP